MNGWKEFHDRGMEDMNSRWIVAIGIHHLLSNLFRYIHLQQSVIAAPRTWNNVPNTVTSAAVITLLRFPAAYQDLSRSFPDITVTPEWTSR